MSVKAGYDLVVVLGQSNASGTNTDFEPTGRDARDPRIATFPATGPDRGAIVPAMEPLAPIGGHPPGGMGPGGPFAALLLETVPRNRRILLVPAAMGGTGFRRHGTYRGVWLPGLELPETVNLFDAAVRHILSALAAAGPDATIAAILWHQGETDGGRTQSEYAADLDLLIHSIRAAVPAAARAPFLVGQLPAERLAAYPDHAGVAEALEATPRRVPNTGFAAAPPIGHVNDVTTHLAASGQRLLGASYFSAYLSVRGAKQP